jgi:hypothetical protein
MVEKHRSVLQIPLKTLQERPVHMPSPVGTWLYFRILVLDYVKHPRLLEILEKAEELQEGRENLGLVVFIDLWRRNVRLQGDREPMEDTDATVQISPT